MQTQQLSQRPVLGVCALAFSLAALTVHAPSAKAGFCVIAANTGGTQPLYVDGTAGTQTLYVGGAAGGQTLLGPSCLAGKRADPDRAPRRKLCLHPYLNVR